MPLAFPFLLAHWLSFFLTFPSPSLSLTLLHSCLPIPSILPSLLSFSFPLPYNTSAFSFLLAQSFSSLLPSRPLSLPFIIPHVFLILSTHPIVFYLPSSSYLFLYLYNTSASLFFFAHSFSSFFLSISLSMECSVECLYHIIRISV